MARRSLDAGALIAPVPAVLVSSGSVEKPNVMTAAWTGIVNTKPPKCYVSIRPERYTAQILKETRELVINLTTKEMVKAVDFCGVKSGRTVDKMKECGLHAVASQSVGAPTVEESPVALECAVEQVLPLGSHEMYLLDIKAVTVREELIDKEGRLALEKSGLIAYAHGQYFALGEKLGSFGYSVRKKKKKKAPPKKK